MADQYVSMDNLRFLLYEVHGLDELLEAPRYADYDRAAIDILLDSFKDFADQELYPFFREMDEQPARYEDGKIIVHPQLERILQQLGEMGWFGASFATEHGGMQMPQLVFNAIAFLLEAANNHVTGYAGLTAGAANLILSFGSQELIDRYAARMSTGEWAGTMALTEPQAGSSLSDITTTAYPQADGSYRIVGQKIFISGGDHEYADNFVHLTLARIEGAPSGTKGISLFAIPKYRLTDAGELEPNDVTTAGDFQKMGQRGYCTTHLVFGERDDCRGWLVGEPHHGLRYMFQMMNEARIAVGRGAAAIATAAYYASLQYARERPQGRRLERGGKKNLASEQTLIINHPDVRRMLLLQKTVTEGALSLLLQSCYYDDRRLTGAAETAEDDHLLLELLTPVSKTYPSEMGRVSVSNGLQVLGGYGFCSDFVLQQYYRDIRIYAIYEGTTGIQSLDLLGRKITMKNGKALQLLITEMQQTLEEAGTYEALKPYARQLSEKMKDTEQVLQHLLGTAATGDHERFLADASVFMEYFSTILVAWQWLKMGTAAQRALVVGNGLFADDFYEAKVHAMKFFYKYELPKTLGLAQTLMDETALTLSDATISID